ncbi:hypothetical protein F3Y22_tig00110933pilonHSYRG00339 [Hibiscus syriacus]|uniref:Reverse transcriptase zinc-binding domain-containing protein n=1 Tax=Hibiscus syriacus TaxID=106335 RepID=A0A6A2ZDR5_HIBSY|nr:hypothetical protein F3Y22_tig00110933pilonHSYRG00339 [Hibiscus syriacus]
MRQRRVTVEHAPIWLFRACLPTLPIIKLFGWRLTHEAIPVGRRLSLANLGNGICPMCRDAEETVLHAMRDCPDARTILLTSTVFLSPLTALVMYMTVPEFTHLPVLLWNLWNGHNLFVHEVRSTPGCHIISKCEALQSAFTTTTGRVLLGVLGAPTIVEAAALTSGIRLTSELDASQVIVESDSANLVRQFCSTTLDLSMASYIFFEAKCLLVANSNIRVLVVRRTANTTARGLAQ